MERAAIGVRAVREHQPGALLEPGRGRVLEHLGDEILGRGVMGASRRCHVYGPHEVRERERVDAFDEVPELRPAREAVVPGERQQRVGGRVLSSASGVRMLRPERSVSGLGSAFTPGGLRLSADRWRSWLADRHANAGDEFRRDGPSLAATTNDLDEGESDAQA
jgi:hypothetical protein